MLSTILDIFTVYAIHMKVILITRTIQQSFVPCAKNNFHLTYEIYPPHIHIYWLVLNNLSEQDITVVVSCLHLNQDQYQRTTLKYVFYTIRHDDMEYMWYSHTLDNVIWLSKPIINAQISDFLVTTHGIWNIHSALENY